MDFALFFSQNVGWPCLRRVARFSARQGLRISIKFNTVEPGLVKTKSFFIVGMDIMEMGFSSEC